MATDKTRSIQVALKKVEAELKKLDSNSDDDATVSRITKLTDNSTRDELARTTVNVFFGLLGVIIVGVPLFNVIVSSNNLDTSLHISLSDLLQQYASILGPILGFVIGYYFKAKSD